MKIRLQRDIDDYGNYTGWSEIGSDSGIPEIELPDAIVTEWGVAELRGCTLSERARRIIAIAAPEYREALSENAWDKERS